MGCPLLVRYSYKISFPGTAAYAPDMTFCLSNGRGDAKSGF